MVFKLVVYILGHHNKLTVIYTVEQIRAVHNRACVEHNDGRILTKLCQFTLRKLKDFLSFEKSILGFDSMREAAVLFLGCSKATLSFSKLGK